MISGDFKNDVIKNESDPVKLIKKSANWPRHNASNWSDDVLPTLLHVGVRFLMNSLLMFCCHSHFPREFHF